MNQLFLFGTLSLLISTGVVSLRAQAIYDNGPPDQQGGWEMTHWLEADDFTLGETTRLEGIKFWDAEINGFFEGTIVWQIYSDTGDNGPGTMLASGTSTNLNHAATGLSIFGAFKEFVTTFDIAPVSLPAGTYWLALHNGPLSNTETQNMFWGTTANLGGSPSYAKIAPFQGPWTSNAFAGSRPDLAFQINGAVAPRVTAFTTSNGGASRLRFTTTAGRNYCVEYKNDLLDSPWTPIEGAESIPGTGSEIEVPDPDPNVATRPSRFYRVKLL